MNGDTILPLLIFLDKDGTPGMRCLCGAEAADMRRGTAHRLRGLRSAPPMTELAPDATDLGVLRMVLHARTCHTGRARMEAGYQPLAITQTPAAEPSFAAAGLEPPAGATGPGASAGGHQADGGASLW